MDRKAQNRIAAAIRRSLEFLSEELRVLAPNQSLQPTLDRSVVSLPLHSFAVKRG